jgi:hypothetical protein
VGVGGIGQVGYYSGERILDFVGLVSPRALDYYRDGSGRLGVLMGERPPSWRSA